MNKLNFLVNWGGNKIHSWSGTNYSIFKSLQSYYDINDTQTVELNRLSRLLKKVQNHNDMDCQKILLNRKRFEDIKGRVFQFSEILPDTSNRMTYIYQDLCVDNLCHLRQTDKNMFLYSGFSHIPLAAMKERNELQLEYYRGASGIFMMGKWMAEYLKMAHPDLSNKIHHVGGGINLDLKAINPSKTKSNNKILFVGRDYRRKGGERVIEAFKILKKSRPDLELHFAGPKNNPNMDSIQGFYFYGDVSRPILQELMNNCDIFCMPSYFEAYGLVFIEALAFGLPCIGRKCCEMPYFIEEGTTGELVDTDDVDELVTKIEKILSSSKYKDRVLDNHDFYLKEYSWDNVAFKMANIIA